MKHAQLTTTVATTTDTIVYGDSDLIYHSEIDDNLITYDAHVQSDEKQSIIVNQ